MEIPHVGTAIKSLNFFWLFILLSSSAFSASDIADSEISDHVQREFILDPVVPFNTLEIKTNSGIVMLSGVVNNILAKERATRIVETVRGVRSVINNIIIDPLIDKSGIRLEEDIKNALIYDAATNGYDIDVSASDDGLVILAGTVDSWAERELAQTVASSVSGVTAITNNINIDLKLERADIEIKHEIEKRLHWSTLVDDAQINVNVADGKVYLTGVVSSAAEKNIATMNAWITGVRAVDNSELSVKNWDRNGNSRKDKYVQRSDQEIEAAVHDALLYDPRVYAFNLVVSVTNGVVILRGIVDNIQAKNAAVRDARNTVGVVSVNNLIKVRPLAKFSDDEIAEQVRKALLRNPYTEGYQIEVRVHDKTAYLDGSVDTFFEKVVAENVAFHSPSVAEVRNNLIVDYPDVVTYDPYVYDWSIYDYPWYSGVYTNGKSDTGIKTHIENKLFWALRKN